MAIAVSLLIAITAWNLLRDSLLLELDGVPATADRHAIADWLGAQEGVKQVHDLHIWALSTTRTALVVHLVWEGTDHDAFLDHVTDELERVFGIAHATVQLERKPCERAGICLAV